MNTLSSTSTDTGDLIACGEVVWDWVCEMDPPPNGDGWDQVWSDRADARYDTLMERTDLLHLPGELKERIEALYAEA